MAFVYVGSTHDVISAKVVLQVIGKEIAEEHSRLWSNYLAAQLQIKFEPGIPKAAFTEEVYSHAGGVYRKTHGQHHSGAILRFLWEDPIPEAWGQYPELYEKIRKVHAEYRQKLDDIKASAEAYSMLENFVWSVVQRLHAMGMRLTAELCVYEFTPEGAAQLSDEKA